MATSLSPSRANDFMQCPLLYRFRAIDRLPEPQSPAAAKGTLVHAVLERIFDLPAIDRTPEQAAALVPGEWARLVEERPERAELLRDMAEEDWHSAATTLVHRWFELENPQRLEPHSREDLLATDGTSVGLKGFVDRLDIAPTGEVRIVDYKTGKAPHPRFQDKALFQMRFYALMYRTLTGVLPLQLQIVYLGSGDVLRHQPTHDELDAVERQIEAIWSAITEAVHAQHFEPTPGRLCDWCHHQSVCPAFGGTPPAFPADAAAEHIAPPVTDPASTDGPTHTITAPSVEQPE